MAEGNNNTNRTEFELGTNAATAGAVTILGVALLKATTRVIAMIKGNGTTETLEVETPRIKIKTTTKIVPKVKGFKATKMVEVDIDQFGDEMPGSERDV